MPEIVRLSRCKICVFSGDHAPPHFHVLGPDVRASIDMVSLQILKGRGQRQALEQAIEWARDPANMAVLAAAWRKLNERD